ncbi:MAG: hypothetical protein ACTHZO_08075 [Moraxellaceae bacterium]|uniref:hypothetical protein n=1 Tax=Psychrobacter sp. TaxID=56811 RepID=UPI003F975C1B
MSMNFEPETNAPSEVQQRRQANMLLIRLQWLVIFLLIAVLLWLYISQQRFQHSVTERLQGSEQVVSRLNDMDDRLFAMSQQTLPEPRVAASSQAQNQLDLLRIQIQAADRLLVDNNNSAAIELLRGLHWQLSQSSNEIAPALTVVIKQGLLKDIENLQAQSSQPSPWQLHNLAIQNIQAFLHNHDGDAEVNTYLQPSTQLSSLAGGSNKAITRRQLTIHETIMTLNLAIQASNMRDHDQLISYLTQARKQLAEETESTTGTVGDVGDWANNLAMMEAPSDISEVIHWLDELIANAPTPTPLLTTQILEKPQ